MREGALRGMSSSQDRWGGGYAEKDKPKQSQAASYLNHPGPQQSPTSGENFH